MSISGFRRWLLLGISLALAACTQPQPQQATELALHIRQNGIHALRPVDLKPWGWDLSELDSDHIHLTRGDKEIPFILTGDGEQRSLLFYGHVEPTRYADDSVYHLSLAGAGQGAQLATRDLVQASPEEVRTQAPSLIHAESDLTYLSQAAAADHWLDQRILAPGEETVDLNVSYPARGPATLTLQIWSASEAPTEPDHHIQAFLNDEFLGDLTWEGMGLKQFTLEAPASALRDGQNRVTIRAPGDTEARAEVLYLDWIELTYERRLQAQQDRLSFPGEGGLDYLLRGFSGANVEVWDVTRSDQPIRLEGAEVIPQDGGFDLRLSDAVDGARQYISAGPSGLLSPEITAAAPSLVAPAAGADYIAVTDASLLSSLEPLLSYRQAQGLRTTVVTTQQIYDRFNAGLPSPEAITAFLTWAAADWPAPAPHYLLLAGDASYDPLNHLGDSNPDLVPTAFRPTVEMGETASDNAIVDLDEDGLPDMAVGRLPAQTPAQMQAMVKKILAYEQNPIPGDWRQRLLFVADDDDPFFRKFNEEMTAAVPASFETDEFVIGEGGGDSHERLLSALNDGRGLVSYMGHGAVDLWAQEEILRNDDIAKLEQDQKLPVVAVWACLSGYFHHPRLQSLGETLVLTPNKGAAAALVPTGQTFAIDQRAMAEALFARHLFTSPTLGDALLASFRELDPQRPGQRDIINTFVLLGDPALPAFADARPLD